MVPENVWLVRLWSAYPISPWVGSSWTRFWSLAIDDWFTYFSLGHAFLMLTCTCLRFATFPDRTGVVGGVLLGFSRDYAHW